MLYIYRDVYTLYDASKGGFQFVPRPNFCDRLSAKVLFVARDFLQSTPDDEQLSLH